MGAKERAVCGGLRCHCPSRPDAGMEAGSPGQDSLHQNATTMMKMRARPKMYTIVAAVGGSTWSLGGRVWEWCRRRSGVPSVSLAVECFGQVDEEKLVTSGTVSVSAVEQRVDVLCCVLLI